MEESNKYILWRGKKDGNKSQIQSEVFLQFLQLLFYGNFKSLENSLKNKKTSVEFKFQQFRAIFVRPFWSIDYVVIVQVGSYLDGS